MLMFLNRCRTVFTDTATELVEEIEYYILDDEKIQFICANNADDIDRNAINCLMSLSPLSIFATSAANGPTN